FFVQAEDGIRDSSVTGVQTCALPISPPLLALRDAGIQFDGRSLFSDVSVALGAGDRVCLVGRNGTGKSTLLRALAGLIELDSGTIFRQPGARVAYVPQQPD